MAADEQLVERAVELLGTSRRQVGDNVLLLPEDDAVYVWTPGRGGSSIIVAADGSVLFATSAIDFDAHLDAFRGGRRTPPEAFETERR